MIVRHHRAQPRSISLGISVVILIALILSACGGKSHDATSDHSGSTQATDFSGAFDQQFIDMMAPHHMGAIEMAKIAQTRAEHPELKGLANEIIASQNTEIGQMKQWRKAWYGSDETPGMDQAPTLPGMDQGMMGGMMHMSADIKNLQTASPFDQAFLIAMIPHHQSAVAAAKLEQEKGMHPELKTLAGNIITGQQKEIDQMQQWLKTWYP